MRDYFWSDIGNGTRISAWYDTWCDLGPLGDFISPITIASAGFRLEASVSDIQLNGEWKWPVAWRDLFLVLIQLDQFCITPNKPDRFMWRDGNDRKAFSTSCVWNSVCYKETDVEWSTIVWFAQCIPWHAFLMWLIMRVEDVSIGENKAPGPDGFTSAFFKHAWDTVGEEVTDAILAFFDNGQLLKQINHTIIALVPKKETPNSVLDYRPISCCNVLFKCISKITTDRLKGYLDGLVSINQSAFVPGRKISDNILLTQELMHNYHTNRGPSRCALKIDIQKAYDTVNWSFLESVLLRFGFHRKMVKWIMTCVSTVSYSLCINGDIHGFFYGKRGLRQGDPLSPYLFMLVMEVLSLLLQHAARTHASFKFHSLCAKQRIINVSFADDLFIFAHGDRPSVKVLRDALGSFTKISGLVPSAPKRRLQLINSVLASMYTYWASVFMLLVRIVKELEKTMRRFLWNGGIQGNVCSKVAWSNVCLLKEEGGLGVRSIKDVNIALLSCHVWSIINNRPSLWVQWIHSYKLKGTNFWEVTKRGSVSWGWRHILAIRNHIRPYILMSILSGRQTNAWSDNWCSCSPLRSFITPRAIANAGFNRRSSVADLIDDIGQWKWPQAWLDLFPVLINIPPPHPLVDMADRCRWKDMEGNFYQIRSWEVWNTLRHRGDRVDWVDSIWFSQCIPRHSFHMWLVINNKLKTQDRMATWEAGSVTNLILMCCPLCYHDRDSRDHLFFQCSFASKV
ncbi:uncharacterized protein LOC110919413 [Helianthus annuus]|uniref:uncharacterized protein LOC110919413 n=1 Tax=Helianthus annuus TaxID=4232 RepID=UPI000B90010D|nr:uncharacterized protein LOC110919413 [Helianthus annuus]